MIANLKKNNISFPEEYIISLTNLIQLVFIKMNELNDYDIYKQIDLFMQSNIRKMMDDGNWVALNKGWKQVYNSLNFKKLPFGNKLDITKLKWIASIYTFWQWKYNHSSYEINKKCNAKQLEELYYPLHEVSIKAACVKLEQKYYMMSELNYDR